MKHVLSRMAAEAKNTLVNRVGIETINSNVKSASYAVRGPIVTRSGELAKILADGDVALPFSKIVPCNIGNPHSLEQRPLTYIRDVLTLIMNPGIMSKLPFPDDIISRAKTYLSGIPGVGAYTESQGIYAVRSEVAAYLTDRDGYVGNPDDIFITNGASEGVRFCMNTILRDPTSGFKDGVLTPIPQYPLYSALTTLLQGHLIPYYLDESSNWTMNVENLNDSYLNALESGINARALVIINPGNPTGQVFPENNLRDIISWCKEHNICLMADEVYQENVWRPNAKFVSCRKVAYDMKAFDGPHPLQLISFHSVSKGYMGECGLRGGYFELLGIPIEVKNELYKLASISLCSNTIGQVATGLMVRPPVKGSPSYDLFVQERQDILDSLRRRALIISEALNSLQGVSCTSIDGALYAFPSLTLPLKAVEAAKVVGVHPDAWYCMELLEATGIVLVPGSGFGQRDGTYHFRTTILPPENMVHSVIDSLRTFHNNFIRRYS